MKKLNSDDSSYTDESDGEDLFKKNFMELNTNKKWKPDLKTWTCAHSSKEKDINCNKFLTDKLEDILKIYETTNDKYRALSYQKAIAALKRYPRTIQTKEVEQQKKACFKIRPL